MRLLNWAGCFTPVHFKSMLACSEHVGTLALTAPAPVSCTHAHITDTVTVLRLGSMEDGVCAGSDSSQ